MPRTLDRSPSAPTHQVEALAVPRASVGVLEQHLDVPAGVDDLDGRRREPHLPRGALPERGFDITTEHCCGIARLVQEPHTRLTVPPAIQRPRLPAVGRVAGVQVAGDAQIDRRLPTLRHQPHEVATPSTRGARSTITGVHPACRSPIAAAMPAIPSPTTNALFCTMPTSSDQAVSPERRRRGCVLGAPMPHRRG
jgi:hypothetical protein